MSSCLYNAQGKVICSTIEHFEQPPSPQQPVSRPPPQRQCGWTSVTEPITTENSGKVCDRWCKNKGYQSYAGGQNFTYRYDAETRRNYGKCLCCKLG